LFFFELPPPVMLLVALVVALLGMCWFECVKWALAHRRGASA
jgi:hypothetical protein